jgi:predicted pyridoxine 5'-phosphate oxidase superfamily flavin-nucleotide-binding protein
MPMSMYHSGNRELQEQFGSTALADRLAAQLTHDRFSESDKAFIESAGFFFLATASADGQPDCSFKAGPKGFARVVAPDLLVYPDYDGNGMFKSLGNIRVNPKIGMLFMAFGETAKRLRVNGRASHSLDDPLLSEYAGAQGTVRVTPEHIFPNCPRYIPNLKTDQESIYIPRAATAPTEPAWKRFDDFKDVVPPRRPTRA